MLTNMPLNVLRKEVGQMKCENCLHYEACKSMVSVIERATMYSIAMRVCNNYADKDLYIKLPCKVGTKVYALATPCGGCEHYNLSLEQSLKICRNCEKREIAECTFDNELIDEFGKTVFLTREDAEKKLEELKNECKRG